ncbi:hypothetical protein H8D29_06180 [PVC group bacterium]|nr:hypothetical protein [PVC group bacterium]
MEEFDEQRASDEAWKYLRANSTATLRFGEHLQDVSYVICNDGTFVIPAMVAMLQTQDMVMYIPEYAENCMELHVSLEQFAEEGEGGEYADRWLMFHGEPPDVQWAKVEINAARFHELFIDGEGLRRNNLLTDEEASICKTVNNDRGSLSEACRRVIGIHIESPVLVGVDSLGLDVRARFGIVRLEPDVPFENAKQVLSFVSASD